MKKNLLARSIYLYIFIVALSVAFGCSPKGATGGSSPASGSGGGAAPTPTPGTAPATTQGNFRIIFVTSTEVNGTGVASGTGTGLASFDALCETERVNKGLGGVFKALVGVGQRRPNGTNWILRLGKEYRREDLTTVIDIAENDVTAGGVVLPFATTALTNMITTTARFPWTGFKNDWTHDSTNCSDWSRNDYDGSTPTLGTYGKSSINEEYVDFGFSQFWGGPLLFNGDVTGDQMRCDRLHPIYCVQTKQLPPPGDKKKMFVSTGVTGASGFAAFDAQCEADRVTRGLSGTYKAVVAGRQPNTATLIRQVCATANCTGATGMSQAIDWTLLPNTKYVLTDNVTYIGETNAHGFFEGDFEEPIGTGNFWTGLTNTWATAANFQMCNGWSDAGFNGFQGQHGQAVSFGVSTAPCSNALSVICAEQ
jgi:hypothetical protein